MRIIASQIFCNFVIASEETRGIRYLLGGILINIKMNSFYDHHENDGFYDLFSVVSKEDDYFSEQNVQMRLHLLSNDLSHALPIRLLFQQPSVNFYRRKDGFLQMLRISDNNNRILWKLIIDPDFLNFEYSISFTAAKNSDFYQLVFNRFLLQHTFINHHGLIIHAAGGSMHGKGMVFPAVSGTGKSTLSHLLLPFPENQLYSEERIIMRKMNYGWQLWGTPWKGTGEIARNESAPLSALVFLSQAPQTKISELAPSAALRRLLETVSIPWYSQEWTDKGLAVCESLLRDIPAFELAFRPDQTAVQAVADLAASLS